MKAKRMSWSLLLRLAVTCLIFAYLRHSIDWTGFSHFIARSDPRWLVAAFLSYGCTTGLGIWRWHILLKACHAEMKLRRTTQLTMIGLFANTFLPGAMGGDFIKAIYASREMSHIKPTVVMSIIMERLLGFGAMFIVSTALILNRYRQLSAEPVTCVAVQMYIGAFILVIGLIVLGSWKGIGRYIPFRRFLPFQESLNEAGRAYQYFLSHPGCFWGGLVLSAAAHFSLMFTFYFVSVALHMNLHFFDLAAVLPLIALVTLLPLTINGIGLREVAFKHFLVFVHMTPASSVALSLGGFFVVLFWSLLGGPIYLRYGKRPRG